MRRIMSPSAQGAQVPIQPTTVPISPGVVVDPWRGNRPWPKLSSLLGLEGWKTLGKMLLRPLVDLYTLSQCTKNIPGFSQAKFKEDVREMYREINRHMAGEAH